MFTPIKAPGPPPDLKEGRLKQWLQDTFKGQGDTLRALALASNIAKPTYGPIVALDLSQGAIQHVIVTDTNAFTVQAPINIGPLAQWQLVIDNQSGGPLGAVSFGFNQFGFADPGPGGRAISTFIVDSGVSYQVGNWQGVPVAVYNVPYGSSVTPDLSKGIIQEITVTDSNPFTINAPANAAQAGYWELVIRNQSGGAIGTVTFDPELKVRGFGDPGNGFRTSVILHQEGGFTHQDAPWTGGGALQTATVLVSSAQIIASTPVQVVAAPGAGQYIMPVAASLSSSSGGYTGSSARIQFGYSASLAPVFITAAQTFLTLTQAAILQLYPASGVYSPSSNLVNQGVFVKASGLSGGTGSMEVAFAYYAAPA